MKFQKLRKHWKTVARVVDNGYWGNARWGEITLEYINILMHYYVRLQFSTFSAFVIYGPLLWEYINRDILSKTFIVDLEII